ncbi:MAG: nucleoside hydrolase [Bacteroidetes bacterium]|nr:nucleoside hydrolase [Bacteroidota bacterium]
MKYISLLLFSVIISAAACFAQKNKPLSVIFDSDMGPDYDDVGAIAMLHAFADIGEAKILATIASCKHPNVAATFSVLNTYFKRPHIPVGVPKGYAVDIRDRQHWTDSIIAAYPHSLKSNEDAEGAVQLYRKILATQPDGSVTIITVGFLTNLFELLKTGSDEYSQLSGMQLVKRKVKQLVSMAGIFPSGMEFNVKEHKAAAKYVFDVWPTPVILSGFEIGKNIKTGLPLIQNKKIQHSPVKDVFRISIPLSSGDAEGRMSWDETAVLVAVKGYAPYYTLQRGRIVINEADGRNTWIDDANGNHFHLIEKMPPAEVQKIINTLMMHQPGGEKL